MLRSRGWDVKPYTYFRIISQSEERCVERGDYSTDEMRCDDEAAKFGKWTQNTQHPMSATRCTRMCEGRSNQPL